MSAPIQSPVIDESAEPEAEGQTPEVPQRRPLRKIIVRSLLILGAILVLGAGATVWAMWPEVEDIPEELEAIDEEVSIAELELPGQGPLEALRLGELEGHKVFLMIEGKESMGGGEGRLLRRALHRWDMPDNVRGFSVGDAPAGAAVMKGKIERDFVGPMRDELKWPIYIDFGGDLTEAFNLPKGHLGLVILDEQGEVLLRHAGDADEAKIAEIKELLGAEEPEPGPPAPAFRVGELDDGRCAEQKCVLVFLDEPVAREEIPGLEEGGFEGGMKESFEQIKKPSVRLARILATDWEAQDREGIAGVIVGEGEGWEVEGWDFVPEAAEARAALGVGADEAAMIIIDAGRMNFVETGRIAFWKLSLAADVLGIEPKNYGKRKPKDKG